MNDWIILYLEFAIIVALIYVRYYVNTYKYQWDFSNLPRKKQRQFAITIFIMALLIAPVILLLKIYEMVVY